MLAYCNILDPGFWIDQAYHEKQVLNKYAYRKIGSHLRNDKRVSKIKHLIWQLRDDLMDLYMIQLNPNQLSELHDIPEVLLDSLNKIIDRSLHFEPENNK